MTGEFKRDANWWREECDYISDVTDDKDNIPLTFHRDRDCFKRYCEMQRNTAVRDGLDDSAQYIQHCIDDLEG